MLFSLNGFSETQAASATELSKPPFLMMNHFEVSELTEDQRKFYVDQLMKHLGDLSTRTIAPFVGLSRPSLTKKIKDEDDWKGLMTEVYKACKDEKNKTVCDQLERDRLETFHKRSRQSHDDRAASHSTSQPTTLPASK